MFRVENDVTLLKNRVRMLKQEHEKAEKKIRETNAKADKLERIRLENDRKFIRQQQAEEKKQAMLRSQEEGIFEKQRKEEQKRLQQVKFNMYQSKKNDVMSVKEQLEHNKRRLEME